MGAKTVCWCVGAALIGTVVAVGCSGPRDSAKVNHYSEAVVDSPQAAYGGSSTADKAQSRAPGLAAHRPPSASGAGAVEGYEGAVQDYDETKPQKLTAIADSEPDRYLIKNATLTIESRDVRAVTGKVIAQAKTMKGYVSDLHETVDGLGTRSVTFVVRVPFTDFDSFLQGFEAQGKLLDREVTAEDVTEEFVDSQSRLHNLRATEERLLAHLSRTGRLSDTLLVEREVTRVREQIDQLTGRLKFLAHRVAFSTFNVTIHETPHVQAIAPVDTFSAGKVTSDAARALIAFGQQALALFIWATMWSVVWLPPTLLLSYAAWRRKAGTARSA
jgi:hypothetical protein